MIAGAVPDWVLSSLQALLEFIFLPQSLLFYDEHRSSLQVTLQEFYTGKSSIYNAGGRLGKLGPINHWRIPKLELMNTVHESVIWMGAPYQWTSDITEHCHITHVKTPYRLSSRRNFHEQCCRYMDCVEKCLTFTMYTTTKTLGPTLATEIANEADQVAIDDSELPPLTSPESNIGTTPTVPASLFTKTCSHFTDNQTVAFTVATVMSTFKVPDLQAALGDFFILKQSYSSHHGKRQSRVDCPLPFQCLHIWESFHMQQCSPQDSRITLPVHTVQALKPSNKLPFGHGNTVLVNITNRSGISGTQSYSAPL